MKLHTLTIHPHARKGSIVPAIAMSLLVIMLGLALVLERMWIDSAQVELTRAAEAAALAAARELVSDDLLRPEASSLVQIAAAQSAAVHVASRNSVAGAPVELRTDEDDPDIRIGRKVYNAASGTEVFLETNFRPTAVVVSPRLRRDRGNPLATLFQHQGRYAADLAVIAAARIDNRVVGFKPIAGTAVPALPLAILADDPLAMRTDTWQAQILQGQGPDAFAYDPETESVREEPDGIPEIVLRIPSPAASTATLASATSTATESAAETATDLPANVRFIDLGGSGDADDRLQRHIQHGWSAEDLTNLGGELRLRDDLLLTASNVGTTWDLDLLAQMQGKARVCLLFRELSSTSSAPAASSTKSDADSPTGQAAAVQCVGFVAGRILHIRPGADGATEIIFQPAVLVTHTAIIDAKTRASGADHSASMNIADTTANGTSPDGNTVPEDLQDEVSADSGNAYIYKLSLTQ